MEIVSDSVSLKCPLGLMRIREPCRGACCRHLQCFDLATFLTFAESTSRWECPVCDKLIDFEDLAIDALCDMALRCYPEEDAFTLNRDDSITPGRDAHRVSETPPTARKQPGGSCLDVQRSRSMSSGSRSGYEDYLDLPEHLSDLQDSGIWENCTLAERVFSLPSSMPDHGDSIDSAAQGEQLERSKSGRQAEERRGVLGRTCKVQARNGDSNPNGERNESGDSDGTEDSDEFMTLVEQAAIADVSDDAEDEGPGDSDSSDEESDVSSGARRAAQNQRRSQGNRTCQTGGDKGDDSESDSDLGPIPGHIRRAIPCQRALADAGRLHLRGCPDEVERRMASGHVERTLICAGEDRRSRVRQRSFSCSEDRSDDENASIDSGSIAQRGSGSKRRLAYRAGLEGGDCFVLGCEEAEQMESRPSRISLNRGRQAGMELPR